MPDLPSGTVTFLLTDIESSTRRWEASPGAMRESLQRHDTLLRELIEAHRGHVLTERGEGDSFFAVFERAGDAIGAAVAAQLALAGEDWPEGIPVRVRMAIHTGEGRGDYRGPDVNRTARVRAAAHGGQVLVTGATFAEVGRDLPTDVSLRDLGEHRLRDITRPERLYQVVHPGLTSDFARLRTLNLSASNIPLQLTSFVGREAEIEEVRRLVGRSHLVTLTGPGGSGKTRLALEAAGYLVDEYPDGARLVELAQVTDARVVAETVAAALGAREEKDRTVLQSLFSYLGGRRLLLILDNCEHLLAAVSELVVALLGAAPGLRVITTSREVLNVPGEVVLQVPSLSLPDPDHLPGLKRLSQFDAVKLFVDRAAAAQASFELTPANARAVAEICTRLDGVPLAIELAAARVKVMSAAEILERLSDRFRLLTGGSRTALARHQTLAATVDWSYDLLTEEERMLFRRLSIFAGGFTLDAAEEVCSGGGLEGLAVLDGLGRLIDKSLLMAKERPGQPTRYRMLETMRQYAAERLLDSGEAGELHDRHLDHFTRLAEYQHDHRFDPGPTWSSRLLEEYGNIRAALEWAHSASPAREVALAGAALWAVQTGGRFRESLDLIGRAVESRQGDPAHVARALMHGGDMEIDLGRTEAARRWLDEALATWTRLDNLAEATETEILLAAADMAEGKVASARDRMERALEVRRRLGHARMTRRATVYLANTLVAQGKLERARALYEEALASAQAERDMRGVGLAQSGLGDVALFSGGFRDALDHYREALQVARRFGELLMIINALEGVAASLGGAGRGAPALQLAAAAHGLRSNAGLVGTQAFWEEALARHLEPARAGVDAELAAAAVVEGEQMDLDHAIALALEDAAT